MFFNLLKAFLISSLLFFLISPFTVSPPIFLLFFFISSPKYSLPRQHTKHLPTCLLDRCSCSYPVIWQFVTTTQTAPFSISPWRPHSTLPFFSFHHLILSSAFALSLILTTSHPTHYHSILSGYTLSCHFLCRLVSCSDRIICMKRLDIINYKLFSSDTAMASWLVWDEICLPCLSSEPNH